MSQPLISAKPVERSAIPSADALDAYLESVIKEGLEIVDSVDDTKVRAAIWCEGLTRQVWSKSSTQANGLVHCRQRKARSGEKLSWTARTSTHKDASYDEFATALLHNHSVHEQQAIEALQRVEKVETLIEDKAEIWHMSYKFPRPTSNRDMQELIVTRETPGDKRSFLVISLPVSAPKTKGYVRSTYASVERVRETDEGSIEWRMATSSDAGGLVTSFITDKVLPMKIAADVPAYLSWFERHRKGDPDTQAAQRRTTDVREHGGAA